MNGFDHPERNPNRDRGSTFSSHLSVGDKLGQYEVLSLLGQGGMGEVYRARDTTLKRDVALKVLPAVLLRDAERMARFQREAEVLASLDHANIGPIYGIIDSEDSRGLVLALIQGPTLANRIEAGPIPLDEAVGIAKQIIEALEYAHDRGVVHRDLKPANVKITPEGVVKVLDFGLAKVLEDEPPPSSLANSPTLTMGHTRTGVILGTAAYMSPEQAVGRPVDRRSDIFSFGAVLYEMLTGKRAFAGATTPDVLEAVVKNDPDWSALPAGTPAYLRRLLERMLAKDRKQRLQAIGEARIALEKPAHDEGRLMAVPSWPRFSAWAWIAVGGLALALAALAFIHFREKPPVRPELVRFQIPSPPSVGSFVVSPDGRRLAYFAAGSGGNRLWIRSMDSLEAHAVAGTETMNPYSPFWSPDSRFVAFVAAGKLRKVEIATGVAETICDMPAATIGGSWNLDGVIILGSLGGGLMKVSAEGGTPSALTVLDPDRGETLHVFPDFLSDGRHFLYHRGSTAQENRGIYVGSLDVKPEQQGKKRLVATEQSPVFVPSADSSDGVVLFLREGTLLAQRLDLKRLTLSGETIPVGEQIGSYQTFGFFSASTTGVLVYRNGSITRNSELTWFDRQGKRLGVAGEAGPSSRVTISPDGTRAATSRYVGLNEDIWLTDLIHDGQTRLTFDPAQDSAPVWSPDGRRIAFTSRRRGKDDLYQKASNSAGNDELLLSSEEDKTVTDWSRDGRFLLYDSLSPRTRLDIWVLPLGSDGDGSASNAARKPFPFLRTEFVERDGKFSPDGRWAAYRSDESGRPEIYVRPFTPSAGSQLSGGKWMISRDGGVGPRWRADGKELYYLAPDGGVMAVDVMPGPSFQSGTPKALFRAPTNLSGWDVSNDGKRFLFPLYTSDSSQAPFTVVLNWQSGLKK
jgi:serine/threonine protein kinase/Tol biopolymer transport system component